MMQQVRHVVLIAGCVAAAFAGASMIVTAQTRPPPVVPSPPAPEAVPQQQAPQQQQVQQPPQFQPNGDWDKLPRMQIERQFAGPLRDTIIQRMRDPIDGTVCYIYLPITAPHSPVLNGGFVQYGGNVIGSINCLSPQPQRASLPTPAARPASRPAASPATVATPTDRKP